jgi:hypothetical protein
MRRVLAASIGESIRAASAAAAVDIRTVAMGAVEASIEASGRVEVVGGTRMSGSETANSAARKLRKKVSRVLDMMLWMKVELVPRHTEATPLLEETADRASSRECEFLS